MSQETTVTVIGDRISLPLFRMVGARVIEANSQREAELALRQAAQSGSKIVIVLKHIVADENRLREEAVRAGVTLLVLPTRWSKAAPINIEKLLMEALGFG